MAVIGTVAARVAVGLAVVGPPAVVAGVWPDAVMDHLVLAVALLGGYAILVKVLLFARKIAAELEKRWLEPIVNIVDRALRQRFSRFDNRYREFVLGSLRFIDLKGLATSGPHTPELDEVFINVSLAFREPNQASGGLLAVLPAEVTDRHSLRDFLDHPQPVVLAVTGAPGSGKTTLLRHTAGQLCRAHRDQRRAVPILLYLRDHVTAIASTPDVALPELVRGTLGRYGYYETAGLRRISRKLTAEEFLTDIESNGLLIEGESGLYSFAHETFQEYLAAAHIRDKRLFDVLMGAVDDVWWRETTLWYFSRSDPDPIVRACLASASATALSLAFDCAEQENEQNSELVPILAPELRQLLDDFLASAFTSDTDPERRRLIAGVLLTRHLRHPIRTGNGGRVCARPITAGLYELYRQDTQCPVPERPTHLETGTEEPITGVRGSDAVAFVRWVNGITGSDTVYRLPNLAEIKDAALHRAFTAPTPRIPSHSVWLEPDNEHGQPELWTPAGTDHPHLIDAATLASHVKDDIERVTPTLIRLLLRRSTTTVRVFIYVRNRVLGPISINDLDATRALATRALARTVDRDVARPRALLPHALFPYALASVLLHTFGLAIAGEDSEDSLLRVMGSALTDAETRVSQHTTTDTWPAAFAQVLTDKMGIAKTRYVVSPDTLADKVHSAQQAHALVNRSGPPKQAAPLPWAHQVARKLQDTALPIFTRQ